MGFGQRSPGSRHRRAHQSRRLQFKRLWGSTDKRSAVNSHEITCYEPIAGENTDGVVSSFVVRLVGKQQEYVPASGRVDLSEGETLVTGCAIVAAHIKDGPSGSNSVAVFRFVGTPSYGKVSTRSTDGRSEVDTNAGGEAALAAA